jgi:putative tricarboxylic transport membrane protein
MQTSDRVSGAFIIALGALAVVGGFQQPAMVGQDVGPSAFPIVVGLGLVLSGILVALGVGHRLEATALEELASHQPAANVSSHTFGLWRVCVPPGLLFLYVALVGQIGFVLTAGLLVFCASLTLGARLSHALLLAILAPPVVHLVFGKLLRVPLPIGLLPMPW